MQRKSATKKKLLMEQQSSQEAAEQFDFADEDQAVAAGQDQDDFMDKNKAAINNADSSQTSSNNVPNRYLKSNKLKKQQSSSIEQELPFSDQLLNALHVLSPKINNSGTKQSPKKKQSNQKFDQGLKNYFDAVQNSQRSVSMLPELLQNGNNNVQQQSSGNQQHLHNSKKISSSTQENMNKNSGSAAKPPQPQMMTQQQQYSQQYCNKNNKTAAGQQPRNKKRVSGRTLNICTKEEMLLKQSSESPISRQKRALDDFAASISASQESKQYFSPNIALNKRGKGEKKNLLSSTTSQEQQNQTPGQQPIQQTSGVVSGAAAGTADFPPLVVMTSPKAATVDRISLEHVVNNSRNNTISKLSHSVNVNTAPVKTTAIVVENTSSAKQTANAINKSKQQQHFHLLSSFQHQQCQQQMQSADDNSVSSVVEDRDSAAQLLADSIEDDHDTDAAIFNDNVNNSNKPPTPIGPKKFTSAIDVTEISSPLPLLKKGVYQAEPEAMWKKRRLKQNLALNKLSKEELEMQKERDEFVKAQKQVQIERVKADQQVQDVD